MEAIQIAQAEKAAESCIAEGTAIEEACRGTIINSHQGLKIAVGALADIKVNYKRVDEQRRSFIDPLGEVIDKLNAVFGPALDALASAEKIMKAKVAEYTEGKLAERDELLAEVQNQEDQKDRVDLIDRASRLAPPPIPGLAVRETWGGKVVDAKALIRWAIDEERFDLLKVDEKLLVAITKAAGADPGIPGWAAEVKRSVAITPAKVR